MEETEEERKLMSQLNNIEKYALRFLETQHDFVDLKQAQVSGMKFGIMIFESRIFWWFIKESSFRRDVGSRGFLLNYEFFHRKKLKPRSANG